MVLKQYMMGKQKSMVVYAEDEDLAKIKYNQTKSSVKIGKWFRR